MPEPDDIASLARGEALAWSQRLLAAALLIAEPGQVASLHKEWRATLAELEQLGPVERSASDDLAARRQARRATPAAGTQADDAGAVELGC